MPWAPRKLCGYGACTVLTKDKYCPAHAKPREARKEYERNRPSSTKRGYGRRWAKLRRMVLHRNPLCKCGALATEVHHARAKKHGGEDSFENLESMCHTCHTRITFAGG